MRGFFRGVLWGSLAAAGGLVVVSQVAGPVGPERADLGPGNMQPVAVPAEPAAEGAAPVAVETGPVETGPVEPEPSDPELAETPMISDPVTLPPEPEPDAAAGLEEAPTPDTPASAGTAQAPSAPVVMPGAADAPLAELSDPGDVAAQPGAAPPAETPALPQAESVTAPAPSAPPAPPPTEAPTERMAGLGQVNPLPEAPAPGDGPMTTVPPVAPGLPLAEGAPLPADLPPPPPLTPQEEALLLPLPEAAESGEGAALSDPTPEPMPMPMPEANPTPATPPQGSLTPSQALEDQATGVVTGRLPRIGAEPAPGAASDPEAQTDAAGVEDATPLRLYARPFDNAAQKPLFAILLQDDGDTAVNRAELAALDMPLSIVIDPLSEGAAARAAIWRAGGQEVVMAGTGIPEGAGPGDLEQSFQVLASRLPEAVAVIDADGTAFQNDRPRAAQVVPILAEQGRGLVTFDQGLNAADQVARREGLPAAMIFRRIDGEGEDSPVIRRYLDRAAFKAAQEGRVIVIGTLRPETVAGVMEWAIEGRASTVTLAPISAMLQVN
ncbi:divergent polysaccharide deacetylase family protein [Pseudotabrizicola formosa]|uniref:divergent polysaccharide deacetylase family protein n=1 Tax=Pseudotabrizicola formosa TaxID=2030009 RepID=UPI001FED3AB7|nr:divergent polysaccharide deacetylase family protein [Pseudotabrizicola formosa]